MNFLAVFFGGGIGALTRYFLYLILPKECCFPYCTLAANFFGCFFASVFFTFFVLKSDVNSAYKLLLITGFCGGLSTLSALSLEVMHYIQSGLYIKAFLYVLISVITCVVSVMLGMILVKKYI